MLLYYHKAGRYASPNRERSKKMTIANNVPRFLTIRQVAATGILSEHHLRLMEKRGELPGIYSGTRFKVNYPLLIEKLDRDSVEVKKQ